MACAGLATEVFKPPPTPADPSVGSRNQCIGLSSNPSAIPIAVLMYYKQVTEGSCKLAALQIETCDGILASMEEMLGKFQGDLGNISTEIRSLQEQSQNMSVKLKNRKAAEQRLGTFLDSLAISPSLVEGIVNREVDEDYQAAFTQPFWPRVTAHLKLRDVSAALGIVGCPST